MKVVVTIATIDPKHGGPARTVPALCRALRQQGVEIELVAIAERGRSKESFDMLGFPKTIVETAASRYESRSWGTDFKRSVANAFQGRKDVVLYDVGLWLPSNHFAAQVAAEMKVPLMISPRGMLSAQAMQIRKWKKRIAWFAYQKRDLMYASVLHATSEKESDESRARGLSQPIAIVPNGVDMPADLPERAKSNSSHRTLLFLSRLHPIKGLKDLVQAWSDVRPPGWRVIIAGPDENDHQRDIERLAESLGVCSDFDFIGVVNDEAKWELFSKSELFILPSHSESFGLAIAEALAAEVPVITTRATPWRELETNQCGWWIDNNVDALAATLREATKLSDEQRRTMGERGRELIQEKYSWATIATKMREVFEWMASQREKPECVIL